MPMATLRLDGETKMENNSLQHHGVLGQKWGVRRYQNKDGSLTTAGKKRYYNDDGSPTRQGLMAINKHKIAYSDRREMQEKFHQSKNKKENEYSNKDYLLSSQKVSKGKEYVKNLKKQILKGKVTSFVENNDGTINPHGKTSKGVVIRDQDGNRVTAYDYQAAQKMIYKYRHSYVNTGMW